MPPPLSMDIGRTGVLVIHSVTPSPAFTAPCSLHGRPRWQRRRGVLVPQHEVLPPDGPTQDKGGQMRTSDNKWTQHERRGRIIRVFRASLLCYSRKAPVIDGGVGLPVEILELNHCCGAVSLHSCCDCVFEHATYMFYLFYLSDLGVASAEGGGGVPFLSHRTLFQIDAGFRYV